MMYHRPLIVGIFLILFAVAPVSAQESPTEFEPIIVENAANIALLHTLGRGMIYDVEWSLQGEYLGVATSIGLWLYNASDLAQEPSFLATENGAVGIAFHPDEAIVAIADRHSIQFWDMNAQAEIRNVVLPRGATFVDMAYAPDGNRLIYSSYTSVSAIHVLDASNAEEIFTIRHEGRGFDLSPDGQLIGTTGGLDALIHVWDAETGAEIQTLQLDDRVDHIAFSLDSNRIAVMGTGQPAQVWDVYTGELVATANTYYIGDSLTFVSDNSIIMSGSEGVPCFSTDFAIQIWNLATETLTPPEAVDGCGAQWMVLNPDKTRMALANYFRLEVWDIATLSPIELLEGYSSPATDVSFHPTENILAVLSGDITIWDLDNFREVATIRPDYETSLITYSPNGESLASSDGYAIQLWDSTSFEAIAKVETGIYGVSANVLNFAEREQQIVFVIGNQAGTWDIDEAHVRNIELVDFDGYNEIVVYATEDTVYTTSASGDISLWSVDSRQRIATLEGHSQYVQYAVASPDERFLLTSSYDGTSRLWDLILHTSQIVTSETEGGVAILDAAFSPDSSLLALVDQTRSISIFDTLTGEKITEYNSGHADSLYVIKFNTNGDVLATGSLDGTIRLWGVPATDS